MQLFATLVTWLDATPKKRHTPPPLHTPHATILNIYYKVTRNLNTNMPPTCTTLNTYYKIIQQQVLIHMIVMICVLLVPSRRIQEERKHY